MMSSTRKKDLTHSFIFIALSLFILFVFGYILPQPVFTQAGNRGGGTSCENSAVINISTATATRLVTNADTEKRIYVCDVNIDLVGGATANTFKFQYSATANACGSGLTDLTGPITSAATAGVPLVFGTGASPGLIFKPIPVANDLCATTTQALVVGGAFTYTIF
jgi:hypothetical protein